MSKALFVKDVFHYIKVTILCVLCVFKIYVY